MADRTENSRINVYINNAQATRALQEMEGEYRKLRNAQKKMELGSKDWIAQQGKMNEVTAKQIKYAESVDLSTLSLKQLKSHSRFLSSLRDRMVPGTEEANRLSKRLNDVNDRLLRIKQGGNSFTRFWKNIGSQMKSFGALALTYLGLDQVFQRIGELIAKNAEFSDSLADVQKTTGMTKEEVADLSKSLGKIDTRSSRKELLALARDAGKLGKTGNEVKKFVEEADKIKVALGEDLGDDAVIKIGKLSKIFDTEMLKIASSINSVGAASEANEQYMVDFSSRLGGVAKTAKLTAPDVIGYGALLDTLNIQAEMSGTALNTFFIDFVKNTDKFEKAAGMQKGFLKELIGEKGTNEGFIAFLEHLKDSVSGQDEFLKKLEEVGVDGARGSAVFLALANNTQKLREQQDLANKSFNDGTSVLDEFNTKNDNLAAKMDKIKKALTDSFVNSSILSGIERMVGWFSDLVTIPVSEKLMEEQREMNNLVVSIQSVNDNNRVRRALLDELIKKYPEYFGKLDAEKTSNEELFKILSKVNDLYREKIALAAIGEEIAEVEKTSIELAREERQIVKDINEQYAKFVGPSGDKSIHEMIISVNNLKTLAKGLVTGFNNQYNRYLEIQDEFADNQERNNKLTAEAAELQIRLDDALKITKDTVNGVTVPTAEEAGFGDIYADADSLFGGNAGVSDEVAKKMKLLRDELDRGRRQLELDLMAANQRELAQINDHYDDLVEKAGENKELIVEINQQRVDALNQKNEEFRQKEQERMDEEEQRRIDFMNQVNNLYFEDRQQEINAAIDKYDALIVQAEKFGLDSSALVDLQREEINAINAKWDKKDLDDQKATNQKKIDQEMEMLNVVFDMTNAFAEGLGNLMSIVADQNSAFAEFEKGLAFIQISINAAKALAQNVALATQAAQAGGPAAPFLIATYIATGVATILGAISQAKKLLAPPVPEAPKFEKGSSNIGGQILKGPSHERGGIALVNSLTGEKLGEAEGDESMLPGDTTRMNKPVIEWMLRNRGKKLTISAFTGNIPQFDASRASATIKYENGGYFNRTSSVKSGSPQYIVQQDNGWMMVAEKLERLNMEVVELRKENKSNTEKKINFSLYRLAEAESYNAEASDLNRLK